MRSIAMDVFAMPEVTVEEEKYDCITSAVDRHSGYIVAVPDKKSKKKAGKTSMEWVSKPRRSHKP